MDAIENKQRMKNPLQMRGLWLLSLRPCMEGLLFLLTLSLLGEGE